MIRAIGHSLMIRSVIPRCRDAVGIMKGRIVDSTKVAEMFRVVKITSKRWVNIGQTGES